MQENVEGLKPCVFIIGAGAAGIATAIELANNGHKVVVLEKNTIGSGASGRNPGRMGHGFHYYDLDTAKAYLQASILVQKTHPGFLIAQDEPFSSPLRHGRYFITKDSNPSKENILRVYEEIKEEYKRLVELDPGNEVFGPVQSFYRILDPSEYQDDVNMDIVDIGIETSEHLFNWKSFVLNFKELLMAHPNISLNEYTEVNDLSRNDFGMPRFTIKATDLISGERKSFMTDYIINSTWQDIHKLNDKLGITMVPSSRTNRLKTLLEVELPESLEHVNSMFFCMGQHCMISNLGNRRAMATYAHVTNLESSTGLELSTNTERLLNGEATSKEVDIISQQMLTGLTKYIPKMKEAKIIGVKFGIVQTKGELSLSDLSNASHSFNKRDDHCVTTEQIGLISNPCMKLFYFIDNAHLVGRLIDEHISATNIIRRCLFLIKDELEHNGLIVDKRIQRLIIENLEKYEPSNISIENIDSIVRTVSKTFYAKEHFKFWQESKIKSDIINNNQSIQSVLK
ncbi:MAG: FAD-dependent oxidoreductase [Legionellaceae bacterium]|nr:FAD-dependent oxidoreductase [Legionellaceae bacterium]